MLQACSSLKPHPCVNRTFADFYCVNYFVQTCDLQVQRTLVFIFQPKSCCNVY